VSRTPQRLASEAKKKCLPFKILQEGKARRIDDTEYESRLANKHATTFSEEETEETEA